MHARTAFTDIPGLEIEDGDANRWLKDCYLDDDAILIIGPLQGNEGKTRQQECVDNTRWLKVLH